MRSFTAIGVGRADEGVGETRDEATGRRETSGDQPDDVEHDLELLFGMAALTDSRPSDN